MRSSLKGQFPGWLHASVVALASIGCVDNESSLFIHGVVHREPPSCLAEADPSGVFLGSGLLDVALSQNYFATFLVGNQMTPRGNKDTLRTETNIVTLRGAEISLSDGRSFSVTGSGSVHAESGQEPGWGLFSAQVIDGATAATPEIDVTIRVVGRTTGGDEIKSGEFVFPVHTCNGCLVGYPVEALATDGTCTLPGSDEPAGTCSFGQDDTVDCRLCTSLAICSGGP